jgi:hypothetical protein
MMILAGAAFGALLVLCGYILGYNKGVRHTEERWTEAVARTNRAGR